MYKKIAKSFDKAAPNYDKYAALQRHIGKILIDKLAAIKIKPKRVLDLGCGTGYIMAEILKIWPDVEVVNIDISVAMCQQTKTNAVCMLAQKLAFFDNSFDLILSNLMLQWLTKDLKEVFQEVARVLKPKGLLLFSTLGPDTLSELRSSWQEIDDNQHVNTQLDMHIVGDFLSQPGFKDIVMDRILLQFQYQNIKELLLDIKGVGASLVLSEQNLSLNKPNGYNDLEQIYKQKYKTIIASYEVIFGQAWACEIANKDEVFLRDITRDF